jgi:hypothetical protein
MAGRNLATRVWRRQKLSRLAAGAGGSSLVTQRALPKGHARGRSNVDDDDERESHTARLTSARRVGGFLSFRRAASRTCRRPRPDLSCAPRLPYLPSSRQSRHLGRQDSLAHASDSRPPLACRPVSRSRAPCGRPSSSASRTPPSSPPPSRSAGPSRRRPLALPGAFPVTSGPPTRAPRWIEASTSSWRTSSLSLSLRSPRRRD